MFPPSTALFVSYTALFAVFVCTRATATTPLLPLLTLALSITSRSESSSCCNEHAQHHTAAAYCSPSRIAARSVALRSASMAPTSLLTAAVRSSVTAAATDA
jgi:hypothetical protein